MALTDEQIKSFIDRVTDAHAALSNPAAQTQVPEALAALVQSYNELAANNSFWHTYDTNQGLKAYIDYVHQNTQFGITPEMIPARTASIDADIPPSAATIGTTGLTEIDMGDEAKLADTAVPPPADEDKHIDSDSDSDADSVTVEDADSPKPRNAGLRVEAEARPDARPESEATDTQSQSNTIPGGIPSDPENDGSNTEAARRDKENKDESNRQAANAAALDAHATPVPAPGPGPDDGAALDASGEPTPRGPDDAALSAGVQPSKVELEGKTPDKPDSKSRVIATTGDILDIVTKGGKTTVTIPRTDGMSLARKCELAQNLVATAITHGAYSIKDGRPHMKINTEDYVLRAAIEEQLDILGYSYDRQGEKSLRETKERVRRDDNFLPNVPLVSEILGSSYDYQTQTARRVIRQSCAKGTTEYEEARAKGVESSFFKDYGLPLQTDARNLNENQEKLLRKGFFDRFILGSEHASPADKGDLRNSYMRRPSFMQIFFPTAEKGVHEFSKKDPKGFRKAGDKAEDGNYIFLNRGETPKERLTNIAQLGLLEGNGYSRPAELKNNDQNFNAFMQSLIDKPTDARNLEVLKKFGVKPARATAQASGQPQNSAPGQAQGQQQTGGQPPATPPRNR